MPPDIYGYRVCKGVKGDKRTCNTPVIMLTSRDSAFDKVRGKMSGADSYLIKPLERAVLLQTINKLLALSAASDTAAAG